MICILCHTFLHFIGHHWLLRNRKSLIFKEELHHMRYRFIFQFFVWIAFFLQMLNIFVVRKCIYVVLWLQKHQGNFYEGFYQTEVTTLAVKNNLLLAGGFHGELICKVTSFHLFHLLTSSHLQCNDCLRNAVFRPWRNKLLLQVNTWCWWQY
jgi:hypothetical protein